MARMCIPQRHRRQRALLSWVALLCACVTISSQAAPVLALVAPLDGQPEGALPGALLTPGDGADALAGDEAAGAFRRRRLLEEGTDAGEAVLEVEVEAANSGSGEAAAGGVDSSGSEAAAAAEEEAEVDPSLAVFSTPTHAAAEAELAREQQLEGGEGEGGGTPQAPARLGDSFAARQERVRAREAARQARQAAGGGDGAALRAPGRIAGARLGRHAPGRVTARQGPGDGEAAPSEGGEVDEGEGVDPRDAAVFHTEDKLEQPEQGGEGGAQGGSDPLPPHTTREISTKHGVIRRLKPRLADEAQLQRPQERQQPEEASAGQGAEGEEEGQEEDGEGQEADPLDAARLTVGPVERAGLEAARREAHEVGGQQQQQPQPHVLPRRRQQQHEAQAPQPRRQQQQQLGGGKVLSETQPRRPLPDAFAEAQLKQQAQWRERMAQQQQQQQQQRELPQGTLFGSGQQAAGAPLPDAAQLPKAQQPLHVQHGTGGGGGGGGRQLQQEQAAAGSEAALGHPRIPVGDVVVMTVMMAATAGLGVLPFFFVKSLSQQASGLATAVACGVMFACSFDLVHTGQPYGAMLVVLGVVLGGLFIRASQQWLETMEDVQFEHLKGAGARKTLLLVGVMAAHALGEGCGVGVSFVGDRGWSQGVLTTLAIGIHNVPEGLAKATVLVGQGVSARQALFWSVLTCLPQPLVAIPSFLFVEAFKAILPIALGFAGGCMIWIVFAELLPDAFAAAAPKQVASAATLAAAGLEGIRMVFEQLELEGRMVLPNPFPGDTTLLLPAVGIMLPAVAVASLAGGLLGNVGLPAPVNWGLASALLGCMGGGPLLHALWHALGGMLGHPGRVGAHSTGPGMLTLLAGTASGAVLALMLRQQLLQLLHSKGYGRKLVSRSFVDLEAAAKKGSDADLAAHDLVAETNGSSARHLFTAAYGGNGVAGGLANGGGLVSPQRSNHHAAINRTSSGGLTPRGVGLDFLGAWSTALQKAATRGGSKLKLAAPQYAAAATAALVLAAHTVPQGWHIARGMAAIAPSLSPLLLPAALCTLLLGGAAGAMSAALAAPSPVRGAWYGGAMAGSVSLWALLALARFDPASNPSGRLDPWDLTTRLQAVTGGALCAVAMVMFGMGETLHPRRARSGLLLGFLLALAVYAFAGALCLFTPYCLDPPAAA